MKIVTVNKYRNDKKEMMVHHEQVPDEVAQFAFDIIKQHAMVSAIPDGEDSSGRQKFRLPTPDEFVDRAFAISVSAYEKAERMGLLVKTPDLEEIIEQDDDE